MTVLDQSGISIELPAGWEGRIYRRVEQSTAGAAGSAAVLPGRTNTVLHVANFPLAPDVADYGGGAVEVMTNRDLLVVLCEFGPSSVGTALFAPAGMPQLTPDDFGTQSMQRVIEGQGGAQKFFTTAGRPFCLYVVLGSYARRVRTVPVVNEITAAIVIA
jgi:hypothetical protein